MSVSSQKKSKLAMIIIVSLRHNKMFQKKKKIHPFKYLISTYYCEYVNFEEIILRETHGLTTIQIDLRY